MVLVHDDNDNVGVRLNSNAIVPRLQFPAATVVIAVNIIHLPSSQSCPSISLRSCGTASRRRDNVTADWGHRHCRHLREGAAKMKGGRRTSSLGWATSVVRRPSILLSEIHRGANGMDRVRHGHLPVAMATTEDRIVSPSTYHLLPPKNSIDEISALSLGAATPMVTIEARAVSTMVCWKHWKLN